MSSQTIFQTRHSTFGALGEEEKDRAVTNRLGSVIVTDLYTQLILSGYAYHQQIGTEDAGVASTTSIDDELVWMLADNPDLLAMIPLLYEVTPGVYGGATILYSMLEVDKAKARYTSGGTAYVPSNLRTDDDKTASGTFFVGTDVAALTKSTVPDSVELARKQYTEDALADTLGYPGIWDASVYDINKRPACVLVGVSSLLCHFGTNNTDATGYGVLQFAQFASALVV